MARDFLEICTKTKLLRTDEKVIMHKIIAFILLIYAQISSAECDPSKGETCVPEKKSSSFTIFTYARPVYPRMSLRLGEEGVVTLRVLVTSEGNAGAIEIKNSSGFPRLDAAAIEAVKTWKFNPATVDGKPIDEWYIIPVPFKINSDAKSTTTFNKNECSSDEAGWERLFPGEELFIKKIQKIKIEPKGLFDSLKKFLSEDQTGRIFTLANNNPRTNDGKSTSSLSIRIVDCENNEIYIETESVYSCPYGGGSRITSTANEAIHIRNWIRISPNSKDEQLLKFVCSK